VAEGRRGRLGARGFAALVLLAGVFGVAVAMAVGLVPDVVDAVARPPILVRAGLAGLAVVLGGWLLLSALRRIGSSLRREPGAPPQLSDAELGAMVRGVRFVFLAAASFTAAAGWLLGEPLPLVIALIIAGVDVVETSFLLLVATRRARD
jgi:hypothetical protein